LRDWQGGTSDSQALGVAGSQAVGAAFSQAAGAAFSQTAGAADSQAAGAAFSQAAGAAFSQAAGAAFSQAFGATLAHGGGVIFSHGAQASAATGAALAHGSQATGSQGPQGVHDRVFLFKIRSCKLTLRVLTPLQPASQAAGSQGCAITSAFSHGFTGSHGSQSPIATEPAKQTNEVNKVDNKILFDILFSLLFGVQISGVVPRTTGKQFWKHFKTIARKFRATIKNAR
jgi:hypothetical protein